MVIAKLRRSNIVILPVLFAFAGCDTLSNDDDPADVDDIDYLASPSIISPVRDNYFTTAEVISYRWYSVDEALGGYQLHVSTDTTFSDTVIFETTTDTVHHGGALAPGPYYMRLKAISSGEVESMWSGPVSFGVEVYRQYFRNTSDGDLSPSLSATLMLAETDLWAVGQATVALPQTQGYMVNLDVSGGPPDMAGETYADADDIFYGFGTIDATSDGGFILSGGATTSQSDVLHRNVWLLKTDASGAKEWSRTITDTVDEFLPGVTLSSPGGGYLVVMTRMPFFELSDSNFYPVLGQINKIDATGSPEWTKSFTGIREVIDGHETSSGGAVIFGHMMDETFNNHMALMGINSAGDSLWTQVYFGTLRAMRIYPKPGGGWLLLCVTPSWIPTLLATDSDGNELWRQSYDIPGVNRDSSTGEFTDVAFADDGSFWLLVGREDFNSAMTTRFLIRTSDNGTELDRYTVPGSYSVADGVKLIILQSGGFLIVDSWGFYKTNATGQTLVDLQ